MQVHWKVLLGGLLLWWPGILKSWNKFINFIGKDCFLFCFCSFLLYGKVFAFMFLVLDLIFLGIVSFLSKIKSWQLSDAPQSIF